MLTVDAGDALIVPPATIHAIKNVGAGSGPELATSIVDRGKPSLVVGE